MANSQEKYLGTYLIFEKSTARWFIWIVCQSSPIASVGYGRV